MKPNPRHIEVVFGKRADGHRYAFAYTPDRVHELFDAFQRLADRDDIPFDWDDLYLFMAAVRARLRVLSEAVQ